MIYVIAFKIKNWPTERSEHLCDVLQHFINYNGI